MPYDTLLSPIHIGSMELKNRLVVPSMGTNFAEPGGFVSQRLIDYFEARAKGGFGLINLEITAVDQLGRTLPSQPGIWQDSFIPGYQQLTSTVHKFGAKMAVQLHHAGRATKKHLIGTQPVAPSAIPSVMEQELPRELSTSEIQDIVEKFGDAAIRARESGFDAVEVHGAHVYLLAQFMSPSCNRRTDEFGGSLVNRMRLPVEIVKNIRKKLGNDFPVIFRISGNERIVGGRTIEESCAAAAILENAGIDAIHVSTGFSTPQWTVAPAIVPMGFNVGDASAIKHSIHIPVIAVGRIHDPDLAENVLKSGQADLIAMGRQSLADPEFPNKLAAGNIDEIAPCISCNQGCIGSLFSPDKPQITCLVSPFCGNEKLFEVIPTNAPKKVMVVGGGPAGLQSAWLMARREHQVTVYEKGTVLGGLYRIAAIPPAKQDIDKAIQYYINMGKKFGVRFELGTEVTEKTITSNNPDVLVLATGSVPCVPDIPGINGPKVIKAADILDSKSWVGKNILIAGAGLVGAETADFLATYGFQITLIDMLPDVAIEEMASTRLFLLERLHKSGVCFVLNARIKEFLTDGIVYIKNGKEETVTGFDTIILALGYTSYNPLESAGRKEVKEVYVIGDALKARKALDATIEATKLAVTV